MRTLIMTASATIQFYYQSILQRAADGGGLAGFTALVDSGTITLATVRGVIISSGEATAFVMPVIRLYQGALGRVPDSGGLRSWVTAMGGGVPLLGIAQGFVTSPEFQNSYGAGSAVDLAYITGLYQRILLRAPDATGLQNWLNAGAGGMSRAQILLGFTESPESIARWTPPAADFLDTLARGAPYPYTSLAETLPPQGTPFTLTVGEDNITGTSGSDVFTAPVVIGADSRAHATLTSLDVLDGGLGEDTLVATLGDDPSLGNLAVSPVLRGIEALQIRAVYLARTLNLSHATGVTSLTDAASSASLTVNGAGAAGIGTIGVTNEGSDTTTTVAGLQTTALSLRGLLSGEAVSGQYHDIALGFTQPDGTTIVPVQIALTVTLETALLGVSSSGASVTSLNVSASGASGLRLANAGGASLVFAAGSVMALRGTGSLALSGAVTGLASLDATGLTGALTATLSALGDGLRVALGPAGNTLSLTGPLASNMVMDGGSSGANTLQLLASLPASTVVTRFATMVLAGVGGISDLLGVSGLQTLRIAGGAQSLVLRRAQPGLAVLVQSAGYETGVLHVDLTLGLASAGTVSLSLVAVDGNADGFAGAGVALVLRGDSLGAAVAALSVRSTAQPDAGVAVTAYQNALDLAAASALRSLSLQADAGLHIAGTMPDGLAVIAVAGAAAVDLGIAGAGLTAVSAVAAQGQVQLNATGTAGGVAYAGSAGVDIVSFGAAAANTIQGNGGNDVFILGAGAADRLVYAAATDAVFVNSSGLAGVTLAHDGGGFERVLNFGAGDRIDLTAFHFTGGLARVLDVSASIGGNSDLTALAGLFSAGGVTYGVAIAQQTPVSGVSDVLVFVNTGQGAGFAAAGGLGFDVRAAPGAVSSASFLF